LRNLNINQRRSNKTEIPRILNEFLNLIGKNPDKIVVQRQRDSLNPNRKIQRHFVWEIRLKQKGQTTVAPKNNIIFEKRKSVFFP
jgi:hypothetical protein